MEFSFNETMYVQTDGVAMGSPLGPVLANIFAGYYERLLLDKVPKPCVYMRYVDDTFSIFDSARDATNFLSYLNSLHSFLKFTMSVEKDRALPFLDVLVKRNDGVFVTSVFRKPTFTGLYTSWNSFVPKSRKIGLIATLVHRALMICSPELLDEELITIWNIFENNGYPINVIRRDIDSKIKRFKEPVVFGPNRCPIYLKLP